MNIHEMRLADDGERGPAYAAFGRVVADEKLAAGVAVGVRFGGIAEAVLEHESVDELLGVDAYDRADTAAVNPGDLSNEQLENVFWYMMGRLSRYGPRYNHVRGSSAQGAGILGVELDFVFLDADGAGPVAHDLSLWFPKLRRGGVIGGVATGDARGAVDRFFGPQSAASVRGGDGNLWWVRRDV